MEPRVLQRDPNRMGVLPDEETNRDVETDRRQLASFRQRASLEEVIKEREYQSSRWGAPHDKQHSEEDWITILTVWLGKTASELPSYRLHNDPEGRKAFRKRLVQLTAIGLAALEATRE